MRTIIFAVVLSACGPSVMSTHVNIPATRHAIQHEIADDAASRHEPARSVVSMGQVTAERAVVYTQVGKDASTRREEVWVKAGDRWTMGQAPGVAGEGTAPASTAN